MKKKLFIISMGIYPFERKDAENIENMVFDSIESFEEYLHKTFPDQTIKICPISEYMVNLNNGDYPEDEWTTYIWILNDKN